MRRFARVLAVGAVLAALVPGSALALPDFVVSSITLTPPEPAAGAAFQAEIVVTNRGTTAGDAGTLAITASVVSTVPIPNPLCLTTIPRGVQAVAVGTLCGTTGLCRGVKSRTLTFDLTAGAAGAKTFLAAADAKCGTAESDERNNQRSLKYTVVPASGPDLVVESILLDPPTPSQNGTFTATVTVRNQGSEVVDGAGVDVWLDSAAAAGCGSTGDAPSQDAGLLDPGAWIDLVFFDLVAGEAGDRLFRAFVDSQCVVAESSETNNQATQAYAVGIPPPAAFSKVNPVQGSTGKPTVVDLVWGPSAGADSYEYCVDTSDDSVCSGSWISTGGDTIATVAGLAGSTGHFWQVRARNAAGATEADDEAWWSFATDGKVPAFVDRFGHGALTQDPEWQVLSGAWTLGGGWYRARSATLPNLTRVKRFDPAGSPWTAGVLQARVRLDPLDAGGANAMAVFCLRSRTRYRYVSLVPGGLRIGQVGSLGGESGGVKRSFARPVLPDRWYVLKVLVYPSGLVKVRLDNAAVGQYRFSAGVPGGVGLGALKARSLADVYTVRGDAALPKPGFPRQGRTWAQEGSSHGGCIRV